MADERNFCAVCMIASDGERCSHCGKPLPRGGTSNGAGRYCRTCIRTHGNSADKGVWYPTNGCRHCLSSSFEN